MLLQISNIARMTQTNTIFSLYYKKACLLRRLYTTWIATAAQAGINIVKPLLHTDLPKIPKVKLFVKIKMAKWQTVLDHNVNIVLVK